jgi:hypothetical protein
MANTHSAAEAAAQALSNNGGSPYMSVTGITTIVWGTDGVLSSYIVTSASQSARVEEIDIEQSSGFEALVILLNKGFDIDVEVIDDTAITAPAIGAVVTLSTPYGATPALLIGEKANQARKREGMRTFTLKTYNAISLGAANYP